jgi:phage shock protein PspC (stress-responsive transcriptional regulator)/predicted membrane protein
MSESTTHIPESRLLQRSRSDRMVAGVAGGLARYFDIHPAVFRVGFVVLTLLGGAGILIYAVAALVMPDEGKRDSVATAALRNRRDRPWPLIGLGLLAVAIVILLSRATLWFDGDAWWLFLIAGGLLLWLTRQPGSETADVQELAREDSRRVRRFFKRLTIALAALLALVFAAVAIAFAAFDVDLGAGIGDRNYVVTTPEQLRDEYHLGIGSLDLDLSRVELPAGETHVDVRVDIGDMDVLVPAGVALRIHGTAEAGEVDLPNGISGDGRNVDTELVETGDRVLVLDASVGAGAVRVERAVR